MTQQTPYKTPYKTPVNVRTNKETLDALDARIGAGNRSKVLRGLIHQVITDRKRLIAVLNHKLETFYEPPQNSQ